VTSPIPLPDGYFNPQAKKQTLYIPADVLTALREWGEDYCDRLIKIHSIILNIQDIIYKYQQAAGESVFIGPAVKSGIIKMLDKIKEVGRTPYKGSGEMFNTSVLLPPETVYKIMKISPDKSFSKCLLIAVNVTLNSPQIIKDADFLANFLSQDKEAKTSIKNLVSQYNIMHLPQVNEFSKLL
jgi:hypothetical protein